MNALKIVGHVLLALLVLLVALAGGDAAYLGWQVAALDEDEDEDEDE